MFSTWTRDNLVRQAAFKGLREDKTASEVVLESAHPAAQMQRDAAKRGPMRRDQAAVSKRPAASAGPAITHPGKVLDAESELTKHALADYYVAVAAHLLPHLADRPLSVVRCPDGNSKPCFFQKHVGLGLPQGVKSVAIKDRKTGKKEDFLTVDSSEGLVGLAQMGVLEIHPWGSRNESLDKPDRIVFDLDPDAAITWKTLAAAAQDLHTRLKKAKLASFVMTTGGKGLHVVVPIRPEQQWQAAKNFAHNLALQMEQAAPELYVTKMSKASRKNRIYLDYLRNDRGSTSVTPYSPRARPGAPVAMPLEWSELNADKPPVFHAADFQHWTKRLRRDPWRGMQQIEQALPV